MVSSKSETLIWNFFYLQFGTISNNPSKLEERSGVFVPKRVEGPHVSVRALARMEFCSDSAPSVLKLQIFVDVDQMSGWLDNQISGWPGIPPDWRDENRQPGQYYREDDICYRHLVDN